MRTIIFPHECKNESFFMQVKYNHLPSSDCRVGFTSCTDGNFCYCPQVINSPVNRRWKCIASVWSLAVDASSWTSGTAKRTSRSSCTATRSFLRSRLATCWRRSLSLPSRRPTIRSSCRSRITVTHDNKRKLLSIAGSSSAKCFWMLH